VCVKNSIKGVICISEFPDIRDSRKNLLGAHGPTDTFPDTRLRIREFLDKPTHC